MVEKNIACKQSTGNEKKKAGTLIAPPTGITHHEWSGRECVAWDPKYGSDGKRRREGRVCILWDREWLQSGGGGDQRRTRATRIADVTEERSTRERERG